MKLPIATLYKTRCTSLLKTPFIVPCLISRTQISIFEKSWNFDQKNVSFEHFEKSWKIVENREFKNGHCCMNALWRHSIEANFYLPGTVSAYETIIISVVQSQFSLAPICWCFFFSNIPIIALYACLLSKHRKHETVVDVVLLLAILFSSWVEPVCQFQPILKSFPKKKNWTSRRTYSNIWSRLDALFSYLWRCRVTPFFLR